MVEDRPKLPERIEEILAWHTDEELKLRGFTRQGLREHVEARVERDKDAPKVGEDAPNLNLELLNHEGNRTGEFVSLSSYRGKPLGLIFGSYT